MMRLLFIFSLALAFTPFVGDAATPVDELLRSPTRPTMETIANTPDLEVPLPEFAGRHYPLDHWVKAMAEDAPRLIALLNWVYPDGTFAFVGRDTAALADIVDAFFLANGEKGRVVRLGVSKPSFGDERTTHLYDQQTPELQNNLVALLKHYGFNLSEVASEHPFILVDTVSSGGGRQSRAIIHAVYSVFARNGGDPAKLVSKFNMIGLQVSTYRGQATPIENFKTFQTQFEQQIRSGQTVYGQLIQIPLIKDTQNVFNELGYDHFTGAWHDRFQAIAQQADGEIYAAAGRQLDEINRRTVLWLQTQIQKTVTTPSFLERVRAEAKKVGYEFKFSGRICRRVARGQ